MGDSTLKNMLVLALVVLLISGHTMLVENCTTFFGLQKVIQRKNKLVLVVLLIPATMLVENCMAI